MFQAHNIFYVCIYTCYIFTGTSPYREIYLRQKVSEPVHKMSRFIAKQQEGIDWVFSSVYGLALFNRSL